MADPNFLPFHLQQNAHIQHRFIQQRRRRQAALGMPMTSADAFAYQNPCNRLLSTPPFHGSLMINRSRLLGVGRNNSMIHKLHQARAWMRMGRRFGIGAHRAARAPFLQNRVVIITREIPVMNHHVGGGGDDAAFTCFQDNMNSTSNLLEGCGLEIHGDEDEKLQEDHVEEEDDGLDLRLKL